MEYRQASAHKDHAAITRLIQVELGYRDRKAEDVLTQLLIMEKHPDYETYVALEENEIVGFAGIVYLYAYESEGHYARLLAFAIRKDKQHQGIGSNFLSYVEACAKARAASDLAISSGLHRKSAHQFYVHHGYHKKGYTFQKLL